MKVRHTASGKEGIITAVVRGVIRVAFKDGSTASGYASSYHPIKKGCLGMFLLLAGATAAFSAVVHYL